MDTSYDAAGRTVATTSPYANPQINPSGTLALPATTLPGEIDTVYDGAGRPTASIQMVDGAEVYRTTISYRGTDETDVVPPAGATPTSTVTNSQGKTVAFTQYLSADLSGTPETSIYAYNAHGDMTAMTNAGGQKWTWTYDPLDRQHVTTDPSDNGATTYVYNDDNTIHTVSGPAGTLQYTYDELGRRKSEADGSGTTLAAWSYDPTFGTTQVKGQLAGASRYIAGSTPMLSGTYTNAPTGYDANYRPTGASVTLPSDVAAEFGLPTSGPSYVTSLTYNTDGSIATTKDPAAAGLPSETVTDLYTNLGHVYASGSNLSTYLGDADWTHINQLAQLDLTNGTTEVDRSFTYADGTGQLTDLLTTTSAATNIHPSDDRYTYDNAGHLLSDTNTADTALTDTQCFQYDNLQNLKEAWTPAQGTPCSIAPSSSALGGPDPYWTSYTVDPANGNRTRVINHALSASGTDEQDTYAYPPTASQFVGGNGGATAVKSVSQATAPAGTAPGESGWTTTGTDNYAYNSSGATTSLPGKSLSYDGEQRVSSTTLTTGVAANSTQHDVYDADGNLLYQLVSGTSTDPTTASVVYLGGDTELRTTPGGGAATGVRTYMADGQPIAERSTSSAGVNTVNWLCASPNGTSSLEIDASTLNLNRRYFDAFGNPRGGSASSWSSNQGYLAKPQDTFTGTTGAPLTQLGARLYDSSIGKFLTPDPVLDPTTPQQSNGYSYANNDPTTLADPSGKDPSPYCMNNLQCMVSTYGPPQNGCGSDASCDHDSGADTYVPPPPGGGKCQGLGCPGQPPHYSIDNPPPGYHVSCVYSDEPCQLVKNGDHEHPPAQDVLIPTPYGVCGLDEVACDLNPNDHPQTGSCNGVASEIACFVFTTALTCLFTDCSELPVALTNIVRGRSAEALAAFATKPGQAVFWSGLGPEGDKIAADYALKSGGMTLEQTAGGRALPAYIPGDAASQATWDAASQAFARGASGNVIAVLGNPSETSTWLRIELPALKANPNVTSIMTYNPSTNVSSILWVR